VQSATTTTPAYIVGFEDKEILDAYKNGDAELLIRFFHRWQLQSCEISKTEFELCPRPVKTIYELFEAFYCEHRDRLEKERVAQRVAQEKTQNKDRESSQPMVTPKQEYLVIQNEIRFVVLDNNEYEKRKRKIDFASQDMFELRNFRPRILSRMERKVLYLDKTHERVLNYFFNETNGDSSTCRIYDEHKEAFLADKMLLHHWHWGRDYHYISFPRIYTVIFNSNLDKAYIQCRDHWYGGSSWEYQSQEGRWKVEGGIRGVWRE
jgi:hypothetical protein